MSAGPEICPTPLSWREVVATVEQQGVLLEWPFGESVCRAQVFGDGPPLYLLGGTCGDHRLFALLAWLLREDFRCVMIETPGTLGTVKEWRSTQAAVTLFIAEQLEDSAFGLFATAASVGTALQLAAQSPASVRSMILQGAGSHNELTLAESLMAKLGRWLPGRMRSVPGWRAIQRENHARWFPGHDETRFEFLLENLGNTPIAAASTRRLAAAIPVDQAEPDPVDLSKISQPTLLVHAEGEGQRTAAAIDRLQSQLTGGRSENLASCGLFPHITQTHRLAKLIREHFGSTQNPQQK